jgi:hypothetical protein
MNALRKIRDAVIAVFDGTMKIIGVAGRGIRTSLKFLIGLCLILILVAGALSCLNIIWLIISSGGTVLFEGDPMRLLGPVFAYVGGIAYGEFGVKSPTHQMTEDLGR